MSCPVVSRPMVGRTHLVMYCPMNLEVIPPGPYLAAVVSSADRTRLNGHDAVRLVQAEARLSSHQ